MKYVNPLTDFGFKKLFGEEPNKDILISLLNDILPEQHTVQDLTYARNERLGAQDLDRKAIYDLYCVSPTGEHFIVELQKAKQNFFKDRSVYYASFPIQQQAQRGDWNFRLAAVYTIGILDFVFDEHRDERQLYHLIELKNQRNEVFYDKLKFIYLELPKFTKQVDELTTNLDRWLYVFRHLADLDQRPAALRDRVFEKLFSVAQISNFSRSERQAYEESLKYYRDLQNVVDTSRAEGIEQGIQRGIEIGGAERALAIARRLLAGGMSVAEVATTTGLDSATVAALRDE